MEHQIRGFFKIKNKKGKKNVVETNFYVTKVSINKIFNSSRKSLEKQKFLTNSTLSLNFQLEICNFCQIWEQNERKKKKRKQKFRRTRYKTNFNIPTRANLMIFDISFNYPYIPYTYVSKLSKKKTKKKKKEGKISRPFSQVHGPPKMTSSPRSWIVKGSYVRDLSV